MTTEHEPTDIEEEIGLPFTQIFGVWKELFSALQGKNGYGGTVAEIYAYRLVRGGPEHTRANYDRMRKHEPLIEEPDRKAAAIEAADTLTKLLRAFQREHPCTIGREFGPREFGELDLTRGDAIAPFDHRIHVEITPARPKAPKPDVVRARRAIGEIGRALDNGGFQPTEGQLKRAVDAICDLEQALFGGSIYDLAAVAFGVPREEAKRRILSAAYGGKPR